MNEISITKLIYKYFNDIEDTEIRQNIINGWFTYFSSLFFFCCQAFSNFCFAEWSCSMGSLIFAASLNQQT
jgi:hypothetical protein